MFKKMSVAYSVLFVCSFVGASESAQRRDTQKQLPYCAALQCWQQTPCALHKRQILDKNSIRIIAEYCKPSIELDVNVKNPTHHFKDEYWKNLRKSSWQILFLGNQHFFHNHHFTIHVLANTHSGNRRQEALYFMWYSYQTDYFMKYDCKSAPEQTQVYKRCPTTSLTQPHIESMETVISDEQYQAIYRQGLRRHGSDYQSGVPTKSTPGITSTCEIEPVKIEKNGSLVHRVHVSLMHDTTELESCIDQAVNGSRPVSKTR